MSSAHHSYHRRKKEKKTAAPKVPAVLQPCLTKDEINLLPIQAWNGPIVLVQDEAALDAALARLWKEPVLGFDTETRPTFTKGKVCLPALIQLATAEAAYLIQLTHLPFGERVAELLSSPRILKVGVAIHDDMKALARIHEFTPGGVVDLAALARAKGIQAQGLRTLSANLLGFRPHCPCYGKGGCGHDPRRESHCQHPGKLRAHARLYRYEGGTLPLRQVQ